MTETYSRNNKKYLSHFFRIIVMSSDDYLVTKCNYGSKLAIYQVKIKKAKAC